MFEQDYIMRMIKDMTRLLARIFFRKETASVELPEEEEMTEEELFYKKLLSMADQGLINKAENLLYDMDTSNMRNYETALAFYSYINEYSDEFLQASNYTRQEVVSGIKDISQRFGIQIEDLLKDI